MSEQTDFVDPTPASDVQFSPSVMDSLPKLPANATEEGVDPQSADPGGQTPVASPIVPEVLPGAVNEEGLPDTTMSPPNPNQF